MNLISRAGRALGKSFWNPPKEEQHDPARRALFGAAAGAVVAGPAVVKSIAVDLGCRDRTLISGDLIEWNEAIGSSYRHFSIKELEEVSRQIHEAAETARLERDLYNRITLRRLAAAENQPKIKSRRAALPGLSERVSRERAHRRVA